MSLITSQEPSLTGQPDLPPVVTQLSWRPDPGLPVMFPPWSQAVPSEATQNQFSLPALRCLQRLSHGQPPLFPAACPCACSSLHGTAWRWPAPAPRSLPPAPAPWAVPSLSLFPEGRGQHCTCPVGPIQAVHTGAGFVGNTDCRVPPRAHRVLERDDAQKLHRLSEHRGRRCMPSMCTWCLLGIVLPRDPLLIWILGAFPEPPLPALCLPVEEQCGPSPSGAAACFRRGPSSRAGRPAADCLSFH